MFRNASLANSVGVERAAARNAYSHPKNVEVGSTKDDANL
jgi:hypothetical protein